MERGVYFDGWYRNNHCYHPSLPMRSMQMVEDLERYHGTVLVWSCLGGGSISLPYLEHEAFGEVDPRLRFYGFMNDCEFIEECVKRGIKPFGIVFEVQGWEFPAKFSPDGKYFRALNVDRKDECDEWYGLREFSEGKHTDVFRKTFKDYYPEPLLNSDGEEVTNLWEECCSRKLDGSPVHTEWVEVKNHPHIVYQMCRNNPVWRDYLKKIIKIQIDAGVPGVQLDECELPLTSIRYGGCFCKDCLKQFNAYMNEQKAAGKLPEDVAAIDFDHFNYKDHLNATGLPYPGNVADLPLFHYYWDYQITAVKKHFVELADYVKAYGREKDRDVLVSGNFFNILPVYYPLREHADIIITEQSETALREIAWYRYVAGFAQEKDVIVAENPYGSKITDYISSWDKGQAYDIFTQLMMEGNVYGCNMSVPYGSWMGNVEKNSFWPPQQLMTDIQDYVYKADPLFSKKSGAKAAVLYSMRSNYWREAIAGYSTNTTNILEDDGTLSFGKQDENDPSAVRRPFWDILSWMGGQEMLFDVRFLGDGSWHEDDFTYEDIKDYGTIVLPDCFTLTESQGKVLAKFAKNGGSVVLFGENGTNLGDWAAEMAAIPSVTVVANPALRSEALAGFEAAFLPIYNKVRNLSIDNKNVSCGVHVLEDGLAVHIINYDYTETKDTVKIIPELHVDLRDNLAQYRDLEVLAIHENEVPKMDVSYDETGTHVTLRDVPVYCALHWKETI